MSENNVRREWREKHRTRNGSSLRDGLGPLQLNSKSSRGLALAAIALTSAVIGATVTGQVFAYKMSKMDMTAAAPVEEAAPVVEKSTIVVASQPLRYGDRLDTSNLREVEWTKGAEPEGAYATIEQMLSEGGKSGNRVVLSAIETDEPVLSKKVTGPGQRATLASLVDPAMRAMTVSVDEILGVAGFVLPGDRVDVIVTRNAKSGDPMSVQSDVLLQDIKVLAIDQLADDRVESPAVSRAVTLEVDPQMAQKLVLGATVGRLALVLRPAGVADKPSVTSVRVSDLSDGAKADLQTINIIRGAVGQPLRQAAPEQPSATPAAGTQAAAITPTPPVQGAPVE